MKNIKWSNSALSRSPDIRGNHALETHCFVLLASPAALVLLSSSAGASPCLSSASAVRQEHPGSWPSWTLRAEGHEGVKCWFPTTSAPGRDQTTRQISPGETATAVRASTPNTRNPDTSAAPVAANGVGPSRETLSPQDIAILSPEGMFVDRFIFEEGYFVSPADDQQAIERFNEAAARLRSTIQDLRVRGVETQ
jgi:hypothetical protein